MEEPQRQTRRRMLKSVLAVAGRGLLHVQPRGDAPSSSAHSRGSTSKLLSLAPSFPDTPQRWEANYMITINHTFSSWMVTYRANGQVPTPEAGVPLISAQNHGTDGGE